MKGNILHTGDMQLHKTCRHPNQQMRVPVQSSKEQSRRFFFKIYIYIYMCFLSHMKTVELNLVGN